MFGWRQKVRCAALPGSSSCSVSRQLKGTLMRAAKRKKKTAGKAAART